MKHKALVISFLTLLCFCSHTTIAQTFSAGNTYWDTTAYVEYYAGNLPIIFSAPHGGSWQPDSIPDRNCTDCSYIMDSYTREITLGVFDAIYAQTGCYPHMIINRLHRAKFDANRDIEDAADGNPLVETAWYGYHAFIDSAKSTIIEQYGRGIFLDFHGHSHTIQRTELGYLLSANQLRDSAQTINTNSHIEASSIRTLINDNIQNLPHNELLRGEFSFGTLMDNKGFPAVPSLTDPYPNTGESYFSGGYNTQRHGSRNNAQNIDAIQLEFNQDVRFNATTRETLIDSLADVILDYINLHYFNSFSDNYCNLIANTNKPNTKQSEIILYPNPVNNKLWFTTIQNNSSIEIYNQLGQQVISEKLAESPLDISAIKSGIYIVIIKQENKITNRVKLVKH